MGLFMPIRSDKSHEDKLVIMSLRNDKGNLKVLLNTLVVFDIGFHSVRIADNIIIHQ